MKLSYDAQKEHRWRFRFVERRVLLLNGDILSEGTSSRMVLLYAIGVVVLIT